MAVDTALSRHNVPVRLTTERWGHIVEQHSELAGLREDVMETVAAAERVVAGGSGELVAIRTHTDGKAIVVAYRETSRTDGFVITAFITTRLRSLERRRQLWPPKN